ncbi:phosphatidylinositol-specific phospholipase C domain-containing protein [Erwinia tracheiphila]|uniref:phosphatidylinositol-specific phospholipase C domain-containing protein n=1 Tax=Erwinia tracheiphila TaxID=65700 RepID=UPI00039FFE6E|nr:phosphatidylinositol-specific phospholipase C domain-containing protein [Erwinia tracheiphila]UIA89351.1 phosphatidylinositol-specific phospholipase C domain-containing protein [Erwinia tracheiphila]UIA97734.1 phosphatidylinositol-specific phospholipase C domain-containing protein [Erwinia tracheiphila]
MNNIGSFTQPKNWVDSGEKGDIYYSKKDLSFFILKKDGNPSKHNWYFPADGTSNNRWDFIQWRVGIFTDPKQWGDSGAKGDIYYSKKYLSFFILKKDGNPSEHNWYFPTDGNDNDQWIVRDNIKKQEWIKYINDERPINQIYLPGTHDSATYTIGSAAIISGYAKTQDDSIFEQLESGVRFIDARCRHISDIFSMHHGNIYLNINFGTVLNDCYKFLVQHPDEFILISVKKEHTEENNIRSFDKTFEIKYYDSSRWFVEDRIPKLKEVRSKK